MMAHETDESAPLTEGQAATLQEFKNRLRYAQQHFRLGREIENSMAGYNESLEMLDRALHHPKRKRRMPKRMHPLIGLAISHMARRFAHERTGDRHARPQQGDVEQAAEWIVAEVNPQKGRPPDALLQSHVEGLMCLWKWTSGKEVTASTAPRSHYDPQLTSVGAQIIWQILNHVDPTVTKTAVVNIIIAARRGGAINDKDFRDYFPLYGGGIDPDTGWPTMPPGLKMESFELSYPIYSS